MNVTVRPASPADAGLLSKLHGLSWPRPWSTAAFTAIIRDPGQLALIADPSGFAVFQRAADQAELTMLAVAPEARRSGLARILLQAGADQLFAQGVTALFLEVGASNAGARALYASLGFTEVGLRQGYYPTVAGGREDAVVMRLEAGGCWAGPAEQPH